MAGAMAPHKLQKDPLDQLKFKVIFGNAPQCLYPSSALVTLFDAKTLFSHE